MSEYMYIYLFIYLFQYFRNSDTLGHKEKNWSHFSSRLHQIKLWNDHIKQ